MSVTVQTVFDKTRKVSEGLKAMSNQRVMAGIPAEKGLRGLDGDTGEEEPINNAVLMYIHEFGAPEANIPARPVVYPAIKSIQKETIATLKQVALDGLLGIASKVNVGLNRIGIMAQNAMRARITDGPFVPLKQSTIDARKRAGYKGEKPLIRTGQLRRALTYVIRKIT